MAASTHSYLSPSSAHRWLHCNAAPFMEMIYGKDEETSEYAEEGTIAHATMEASLSILRDGGTVEQALANIDPKDTELLHCAKTYVNAVRDTYFEEPEYFGIEETIDLSEVFQVPDQHGTVDCVIISAGHLHVFDYKHGVGVNVSPDSNPQLSIYALGYLLRPENESVTDITLHIVQPRSVNGQAHKTWTTSRQLLIDTWEIIKDNAINVRTIFDSQVPSDDDFYPTAEVCRWCRAKHACNAFAAIPTKALGLPKQLPSPLEATADQLGAVLTFKPLVEDWFKQVDEEAYRRLSVGDSVTGYKLVLGNQGIRRWSDKAKAEELIVKTMRIPHEYAYKKELISPTRADDLAHKVKGKDGKPIIGARQWKSIEELITRNAAKPVVVQESDKRPAIPLDIAEDMEVITDGKVELER